MFRSDLPFSVPKEPLHHDELTDIIDLALWAGQMLMQHGAEASRIEETVHHIGTGLGCDWLDVLILSQGITVTATSGGEFRTKARRVTRMGVNFSVVDMVNDLSHRVYHQQVDRFELRSALQTVSTTPEHYNRWLVVGLVGLACGAFSRLFGADMQIVLMTIAASSMAMFVRQELTARYLNSFLVVVLTAFTAGIFASLPALLDIGASPELALAASVLLLVPGVPLISAVEDILQGHFGTGLARGAFSALIALGIAIGLSIAMRITGAGL
ncbi:MAG: threonine/serine ThrE exporter family protein [Chloroflexota bacterium]